MYSIDAMPSMRRIRLFGFVVFAVVVYILYLTNTARHTSRSPDFYSKTKDALDRDKGSYHPHGSRKETGKDDEDEALAVAMSGRLKEAEQMAKDKANAKAPNPPEGFAPLDEKAKPVVEDIEPGKPTNDRNVAGRKKHAIEEPREKPLHLDYDLENKDVKEELNTIFKRAPSKSNIRRITSMTNGKYSLTSCFASRYIFQVLLSTFETGETNSSPQIQHCTGTLCRRA